MRSGPYVGLDFFHEEDEHLFFGRDADRRRVIGSLGAARLTLLYAESGVGKSSLLRAGVAAPLRARSSAYVPVVFKEWTADPTPGLIAQLEAAVSGFTGAPRELPRDSLEQALVAAARATGAMPLVILDQFEDHLLYQAADAAFDDELAACVNRADMPANLLISVRQDAYSEIGDRFKSRIPDVYGNFQHLDYLDEASAHEAAERPIKAYERRDGQPSDVEPELVDELLGQLRHLRRHFEEHAPGGAGDGIDTTFLQLVLERVWQAECHAGSPLMRRATLLQLGGAKQIVQGHFEDVMDALPRKQQDAWAQGFRMLVTSTGRKIALSNRDISELAEVPMATLEPAAAHLEERRILRRVPGPGPQEEPRREIFHDALAPAILDWRRKWFEKRAHAKANRRAAAVGGALLVVAVVAAFVVWALRQNQQAGRAAEQARVLTLAAAADRATATRPDVAMQLALDAYRESRDPEYRRVAVRALSQVLTPDTLAVLSGPPAQWTAWRSRPMAHCSRRSDRTARSGSGPRRRIDSSRCSG